MNGFVLMRLAVSFIICIVLQICTKRVRNSNVLKTFITINIVCLAINGFSLASSIIACLMMHVSLQLLLDVPNIVMLGLEIWHIFLTINARKQRDKLQREDTIQVVYCGTCGMASTEGALFCRKCGKKLEQKEKVV